MTTNFTSKNYNKSIKDINFIPLADSCSLLGTADVSIMSNSKFLTSRTNRGKTNNHYSSEKVSCIDNLANIK